MSPPTSRVIDNRRNTSAEANQTVESLARQTEAVLARFGVSVSRSKVSRLVRRWISDPVGDFGTWIAQRVVAIEHRRRVVADELRRCIAYADPTGDTAVAHVLRERGF